MTSLLEGRVAMVTGAGRGLGRAHALALAAHGARVVVNDLDPAAAGEVCAAIEHAGGQAFAACANVCDPDEVWQMMATVLTRWGQIDILVNNAGILRDRTFAKQDLADFRLVIEVHLMGSVHCAHAVWPHMKQRGYGRVIFTTSSSGLYGNFGQPAYSAAKMGLVGLMQTLALEGERYGIRVNCLAPSAATQMTAGLWTPEEIEALDPARVGPAVVALASEAAPSKRIVLAGAGSFKEAHITMTEGIYLSASDASPQQLLAQWDRIAARSGEQVPATGFDQYRFEVARHQAQQSARQPIQANAAQKANTHANPQPEPQADDKGHTHE